jgi:organic hydroperoxide reductase OsmC/OhrA
MAQGKEHHYSVKTVWTGAGQGPARDTKSYSRAYRFEIDGKPPLDGSADPAFRGDPARHNPEDLLVASLSACHMLWYLHLCTVKGVTVIAYEDAAEGTMVAEPHNGRFTEVTLRPVVTITPDSDAQVAESLHEPAHAECFVANSVNFPVRCAAKIVKAEAPAA